VEYRFVCAQGSRGWFGKQSNYIWLSWFHNARLINERFRGWRRISSVDVREDKNSARDYQANEYDASKKKELASAKKTHFPMAILWYQHDTYILLCFPPSGRRRFPPECPIH